MFGPADSLFRDLTDNVKIDFPLHARLSKSKIGFRKLGRVVKHAPASRIQESILFGKLKRTIEVETQLGYDERNTAFRW